MNVLRQPHHEITGYLSPSMLADVDFQEQNQVFMRDHHNPGPVRPQRHRVEEFVTYFFNYILGKYLYI